MTARAGRLVGATGRKRSGFRRVIKNYDLYLLFLPAFAYFIIFHYGPMYGVQIAFRDFMPMLGVTRSPWVGLEHFVRFLRAYQFWDVLSNTVFLSLYSLLVGFPIPVILALFLNHLNNVRFKRLVQTIMYAPHFISVMVVVGMLFIFLSPRTGLVNHMRASFGQEAVFFMGRPDWFRSIYVWSGVWQSAGWSMIIYIAALTSIDPSLHESAVVDGAGKLKRIWHIDIPGLLPTISILLILSLGNIMSVGFEKVYLMQNSLNVQTSEVIATYVYKVGLLGTQFSYSAAIGLFNSLLNCMLLVTVNFIGRRMGQTTLW